MAEDDWRLSGYDRAGRSIRFELAGTVLRLSGIEIGRHRLLAGFVIDDATVSRRHVRIFRGSGGIYAEDLHSLNGTFIDEQRIKPFQPVPVSLMAWLRLGAVSLQLGR